MSPRLLIAIMPNLILKRNSGHFGKIRKINIRVGDIEVGVIGNGETKSFVVQPGQNTIFAYIKEGNSNIFDVNVEDGKDVELVIKHNKFDAISSWIFVLILLIFIVFLGPSFYLNYIYYVVCSLLFMVFLIVRKMLNVTAFIISSE